MQVYLFTTSGDFSGRDIENQIVNLADFERFDSSREIDVAYLKEIGVVSGPFPKVKILGEGELNGAFKVKVHGVSASAKAKIEEKGGSVEVVPYEVKRAAQKASGASDDS